MGPAVVTERSSATSSAHIPADSERATLVGSGDERRLGMDLPPRRAPRHHGDGRQPGVGGPAGAGVDQVVGRAGAGDPPSLRAGSWS